MDKKESAGLLMYDKLGDELRILLVHPGGPYFAKKGNSYRSIPKGELNQDEDKLACAQREFTEELGLELKTVEYLTLGSIKQKGGKTVTAWAFQGIWEEGRSPQGNTFELEWPPRSGNRQHFPEIDRAEMFTVEEGKLKINKAQIPFIERLVDLLTPNINLIQTNLAIGFFKRCRSQVIISYRKRFQNLIINWVAAKCCPCSNWPS